MILISHRGNINGKIKDLENSPQYIKEAITLGYNIEIDIWEKHGKLYLGHDAPLYDINNNILFDNKVWCHAKNHTAFEIMLKENIHCFWHNTDDMTLTSRGYVWTYPDKELIENSVCVLPEVHNQIINDKCIGICSDFIQRYKV